MSTHTEVKRVDKFFKKNIKNPFLGNNIIVYADLQSASFFHNGILVPVMDGIRTMRKDDFLNEDNNIEVYLRCTSPNSFRITYRLRDDDMVHAMTMATKDDDFVIFSDPLV